MRVLMCPPQFIQIAYEINDHMDKKNPPEKQLAVQQWQNVVAEYAHAGIEMHFIEPDTVSQDMCFAANAAWLHNDIMILSNYAGDARVARQREVDLYRRWFSKYQMEFDSLKTIYFPSGEVAFDGQGDVVVPYVNEGEKRKPIILMGYGTSRTDREAAEVIRLVHDMPKWQVVPMKLTNGLFYHLDTCCVFIEPNIMLYYAGAFDNQALRTINSLGLDTISVSEKDAHDFVCNGTAVQTQTGMKFIVHKMSSKLHVELMKRKIEVIETNTSEFLKNGGSVRCLTLVLPERT